jgi:hypothetical protein
MQWASALPRCARPPGCTREGTRTRYSDHTMPTIKEITLYTLPELREAHPHAYAKAWERHRQQCWRSGPDWAEENADSLRAILDAAGASIGHRGRLSMDTGRAALSGRRAWAWLENQLLGPCRIPWLPMHANPMRRHRARHERSFFPGRVRHLCATDEALIDDIRDSLRSGMTVGDALRNLPDVVDKLNDQDVEYAASEEQFLATNEGTLYNNKGEQE